MTDHFVWADPDKCTKCGMCVKVCRGTLGMGKSGPEVIRDFCITCGHCVAVCPNGALDNERAPLKNQTAIEKALSPDAQARSISPLAAFGAQFSREARAKGKHSGNA